MEERIDRGPARTVEGYAELGGVLLELVEGAGAESVGADLVVAKGGRRVGGKGGCMGGFGWPVRRRRPFVGGGDGGW